MMNGNLYIHRHFGTTSLMVGLAAQSSRTIFTVQALTLESRVHGLINGPGPWYRNMSPG